VVDGTAESLFLYLSIYCIGFIGLTRPLQPQVPARATVLIALAQPDAELDGNLEDDSYPHAIGVYLLKAGEGQMRKREHISIINISPSIRLYLSIYRCDSQTSSR